MHQPNSIIHDNVAQVSTAVQYSIVCTNRSTIARTWRNTKYQYDYPSLTSTKSRYSDAASHGDMGTWAYRLTRHAESVSDAARCGSHRSIKYTRKISSIESDGTNNEYRSEGGLASHDNYLNEKNNPTQHNTTAVQKNVFEKQEILSVSRLVARRTRLGVT